MSQKKLTSSTNPWRSLLTMEKFFIGYNLGSYGVFFVALLDDKSHCNSRCHDFLW